MMCQRRFFSFNKGTTLVGNADSRGGSACVGTGDIWKIFVPSFQFCCEPKTALKYKVC